MNDKIIAVYTICNTLAIAITGIEYGIEDKITSVFITEDCRKEARTTKLHTDKYGKNYFIRHKTKYYIDDFMLSIQ